MPGDLPAAQVEGVGGEDPEPVLVPAGLVEGDLLGGDDGVLDLVAHRAAADVAVELPDRVAATKHMSAWPDFPYPTQVVTRTEESRVVISCMLSDIVHEWSLEPVDTGCAVRIRIDVPEDEASRLPAVAAESTESLDRLVALAEAAGA